MKNIKIPGCGSPQRRGRRDLGISAEVANFAVRCAVAPLPYRAGRRSSLYTDADLYLQTLTHKKAAE